MDISRKKVIFLDSSIILRHFLGDSTAKNIIEDSSRFAINSIVFNEVSFNHLKLLYEEKYGEYRFYDMKSSLLPRDYGVLKGYEITWSFLDELYSEDR